MKTKDLILVGLFAALTALGASLSIPIQPAPISMQSFFVILSGLILGARLGALSQLVYILVGVIGLPVFSGMKGGLQVVLGPTFGFLIGFVIGAYIIGKIAYMGDGPSSKKIWLASLVGSISFYAFGLPYMYLILNLYMGLAISPMEAIKKGLLVFIPGDLLKFILASILASRLLPLLRKNLRKADL